MFEIIQKSSTKAILKLSGNVQAVLEGCVTNKTLVPLESSDFSFALGSGTFSISDNLGEALIVDSAPYISWVDGASVRTERHHSLKSPFMLGLDKHQVAAELLYQKPGSTPITLKDLYQELTTQHPQGFAIVGQANFTELDSVYLQKPPIFGANIIQHSADYWKKIPKEANKQACFFGIAIPNQAKKYYSGDLLMSAFYQNPNESNVISMLSHTHAAVLKHEPIKKTTNTQELYQQIQDRMPMASIRRLQMPSVLHEGVFAIFSLSGLAKS